MSVERSFGFGASEEDLTFYNGKAVLDLAFVFLYDDEDETEFDFIDYASAYLNVYDERSGQLLKSYTTQISRNSSVLVMNASVDDMTFEDVGKYYYEMGYVRSGYEMPLRYGQFFVI
jgi:hypothetical protein